MIVDDEREERDRLVSWIYLIVAGLLEIGWPVGFMAASGFCLWMAQKQIPIGTAYAVWTGIGAAGTFLVGVMFYGDPSSLARYFGVALIVAGVVVLKGCGSN